MLDIRFSSVSLKRATAIFLAVILAFSLVACGGGQEAEAPKEPPAEVVETSEVICASTTSTEDSGLFSVLLPAFEEAYPQFKVSVVAVGTGQALEIGRNRDADVLFVHAKADEEQFVADGYGTDRQDVMYNDFIIVGPESDPAGVKGEADVQKAFKTIADGKFLFVSRGDDSGTHKKEMKIWEEAGIEPSGEWYNSIGQGMGDTLIFANESEGYAMTDRGTFLSMQDKLDLVILVEGDKLLLNQYGVIPVTDAKNPEGARAFADWVVSPEGQAVIGEFGVEEFGQPLFFPNAK